MFVSIFMSEMVVFFVCVIFPMFCFRVIPVGNEWPQTAESSSSLRLCLEDSYQESCPNQTALWHEREISFYFGRPLKFGGSCYSIKNCFSWLILHFHLRSHHHPRWLLCPRGWPFKALASHFLLTPLTFVTPSPLLPCIDNPRAYHSLELLCLNN